MSEPGGLSVLKSATAKVQILASTVKHQGQEKLNITFFKFEVISFKYQAFDGGVIYFVKVDVGDGCVHIRINDPSDDQPPLMEAIELKKTLKDEVEPLEPNMN